VLGVDGAFQGGAGSSNIQGLKTHEVQWRRLECPDLPLPTAARFSWPSPPRPPLPSAPASGRSRTSRIGLAGSLAHGVVTERRDPGSRPSNDLYLRDRVEPLNVSREHFAIDRGDTGYILVDRESTCGTLVEGQAVGGDLRGGSIPLHDGDVIIVGTSLSPYVFKFRIG
jgi:hypothetical protein